MSVIGTDMNFKSVFNLEKSYVVDQHKGRMSLLAPNSGMLVRSMPALSKALDSHNAQPESSALRSFVRTVEQTLSEALFMLPSSLSLTSQSGSSGKSAVEDLG
ncbi:hypothetical protein BLNAU_12357 [Blattamonas nauphoetae]|uniref:Uncharacterized protein n=1 Tax=Blattamonas nauphoetae TaxID=2049346 RepID=A0ABQ9WRD7_9EUKA|nr:hypothetical protein BLNAU_23037 [Blattamonas nauphoetae]KAK2952708.1 hypothetical protein BLNAU_12357 [Blattamonas nauphoetae]